MKLSNSYFVRLVVRTPAVVGNTGSMPVRESKYEYAFPYEKKVK